MGRIADILVSRGEWDEALRIRREEQLPVFSRFNEARALAVAYGRIADIFFLQGELDKALQIRQEEELPVYIRLGDARERAAASGKIADIHVRRGDLDKALHLRQEEELPVYERLGEVRSYAITLGKTADIYESRGELEEALRIREEKQLPLCDRLDDARVRADVFRAIALILEKKGDWKRSRQFHEESLDTSRRCGNASGIAGALWDISQIDMEEKNLEAATARIVEAYSIVVEIDETEGIAAIGKALGLILALRGQLEEGLEILHRSAEMYKKLGEETELSRTEEMIDELRQIEGSALEI